MLGELFLEEFVMGEEKFHEGRAGLSCIIKKTMKKINMKKFFQLKLRRNIKT